MKSYIQLMFFSVCANTAPALAFAQSETTDEKSFSFHACYTGDLVSNFSGGIKTGTTYLGLANLKAGFDTEKAGWWKNGELFLNVGNTHGGEPSAKMVGDFQGVSNIEAGDLTFLYELWYRQKLRNLTLTAGLQDLNANFAVSDNGGFFVNSSFGIHSSIADNISSPIFPLTALGFTAQWDISEKFKWQAAVFDGTPDDYENNPYNTEWNLSENDGLLCVTEFQLVSSLVKDLDGCYKAGAYYHQHNDTIAKEQENYGFYFVADQMIYRKGIREVVLFSQLGLSPKDKNFNNLYCGLGATCKGILDKRPNDVVGMAVAYAGFHDRPVKNETACELSYQLQINDNIYLKPDIQYIIHPAGMEEKLDNALVGALRLGVEF